MPERGAVWEVASADDDQTDLGMVSGAHDLAYRIAIDDPQAETLSENEITDSIAVVTLGDMQRARMSSERRRKQGCEAEDRRARWGTSYGSQDQVRHGFGLLLFARASKRHTAPNQRTGTTLQARSARDARVVATADRDDACPGMWVEIDPGIGYCSLGDECRNPVREAHERRVGERSVGEPDAEEM
jgi:hypothetical protein